MVRYPITPEGYKKLSDELHNLKTVERPKVIEMVAKARSYGDLSENSEYEDAKERQSLIESRITTLETMYNASEVINTADMETNEKVLFGSVVSIVDEDTKKKAVYHIVGEYESDLKNGKISIASPIAKALVGSKVGDTVEVYTPSGERHYYIEKIEF